MYMRILKYSMQKKNICYVEPIHFPRIDRCRLSTVYLPKADVSVSPNTDFFSRRVVNGYIVAMG